MMTLGDFENLSTVFRYHIEIAKLTNNFTERVYHPWLEKVMG